MPLPPTPLLVPIVFVNLNLWIIIIDVVGIVPHRCREGDGSLSMQEYSPEVIVFLSRGIVRGGVFRPHLDDDDGSISVFSPFDLPSSEPAPPPVPLAIPKDRLDDGPRRCQVVVVDIRTFCALHLPDSMSFFAP
jgi:hypothetical protein